MSFLSALFGRHPVVEHAADLQRSGRSFSVGPEDLPFWFRGMGTFSDPVAPALPIDRRSAIQVPAVKRVRDLIAGTIGALPLNVYDADRVQLVNPLLDQPERHCARMVTMTLTVEDLLFGDGRSTRGIAWWRVTEREWTGYPLFVKRIEPWRVSVDTANDVVRVDGKEVPQKDLIRFDSPNDALLVAAARAIRMCLQLDATAAQYADDPQAREYFTPADDAEPRSDEEIRRVLSDWKAARKARSTGYVPDWLELNNGQLINPKDLQLTDARQHAVLEIARAGNVDPEELGVSTTSRTYANQFDRRKQFVDFTLGPFLRAIEERLSMGDVTQRGRYTRFDLDAFMRSDALSRYQSYEVGLRVGALGKGEIRELEDKPDLTEEPVNTPQSVAASNKRFDKGPALEFTAPAAAAFKVDQAKRTITGLAVPFGVVGTTGGQKWVFTSDSLVPPDDPTRVKLLMDHSFGSAVGYCTEYDVRTDGDAPGIYATFKVARGPEGDRALTLAEDKVYDGLSVGLGYGGELSTVEPDGALTYNGAPWLETSLTPLPAFSDARVTAVAASAAKEGSTEMKCTKCGAVHANGVTECDAATLAAFAATSNPPAGQPETAATFSTDEMSQLRALLGGGQQQPEAVSATAGGAVEVKEELPYRFDRGGRFIVADSADHVFSADLHDMARANDQYGDRTEAGKRVMGLIRAAFAVSTGDVNETNPTINRPDMFVDQRDYRTPLWNFVDKGAPPNGVQPFRFPKFSSAAGLVGDHTEGEEPASGTYVTTDQTVTPTALSGKASITREVWDMGGNPAVSNLIWNQMLRGWKEGLETATATFLNTLTAAADITLAAGSADDVLQAAWDAAVADLQFIRGYDFEAFALEKELYKKFVAAVDGDGRKLYPQISPQNANGTSTRRFTMLDLAGVTGVPSWALPSTPGSPNNSWLFDPMTVHGWASSPQRLEFPGTAAATTEDPVGSYAPVAMVDLAIWGYKAFANSDIGGVRQVIYDTVA